MWNYLVCSIFWLSFTWLLFAFGNALVPQKKSQSFKFVTAYLTYSLFVAVGGIIVQLLDLPWIVFAVYMGIVLLSVLLVVLLAKRKRGRLFSCSLKEYIAENWFIYLLCALCCVMLLLYFRLYWYGTHLDDGFYITKVALISGSDSFRDNLTVGMGKGVDISYLINTWEIEASFFVKILRVTPTVFLRLFQSAFNYFLFFNSALAFGGELLISIKKKANLKLLQYVLGVFLLFFIYYVWLMDSGLFFLRDMFHLNCAMFYGSSIAKLMVFICPLLYFLRDEKINLRMVVGVALISLVMLSKTSVVLTASIVLILASCVSWLLFSDSRISKWLLAALVLLVCAVAFVLPNNADIQAEVYKFLKEIVKSPVLWVCLLIFLLSFRLKSKVVYRLNTVMIVSAALMLVPQLNDLFEKCSFYAFVAARSWGMWIYTFVIINAFYSYALLEKVAQKSVMRVGYLFVSGAMGFLMFYAYHTDGAELFVTENMPAKTSIVQDLKVILNNRKFMPNAVNAVGEELEKRTEETGEQLYVVSPMFSNVYGGVFAMNIQLRVVAPDVISVSAVERYPVNESCALYGYDQSKYDAFVENPSEETMEAFEQEFEKYQINCVISQNAECGQYLQERGFGEATVIENGVFYIWYRELPF